MSEESDDKQHEPTQKRLDEARKRGEIPKSNDLIAAAALAGFLIATAIFGNGLLDSFGRFGSNFLNHPSDLADLAFTNASPLLLGFLWDITRFVSPIFILPAIAAMAAILAQRAFSIAPEKVSFKFSRISIVSNAGQKFGGSGLFEFAKSFAKLVTVGVVLIIAIGQHENELLLSIGMEPAWIIALCMNITFEFLAIVLLIFGGFGAIDYLWQMHTHHKKNMMSRKEVLDEAKDAEGDPHFKQHRRQMGHDIATAQNIQEVATADVVIVNPTHYSVALKWDKKGNSAPICVAKGVDEIAARIREKAAEHGVPLHSDPPTARAIFATVGVGEQIKSEHFRAVAAAIRFSEKMRKTRRSMANGKQ